MMKLKQMTLRALSIGFLMALTLLTAYGDTAITLMHVHGLAFSPDGQRLSIPSHHGLAIYSAGRWSEAPGPKHDYMGYSVTRRAIYSSGHPAQGSGLTNPLGLIKSSDDGQTWQPLGLQGESDFHLLATGFESGAIYVINSHANSRMSAPGLYFSLNEGVDWQHAAAQGIAEAPIALAVHPTDSKVVALTTRTGLYLSRDAGEHFQPLSQGEQAVGLAFSLDGLSLWFGSYGSAAKLSIVELATGQITPLSMPELQEDAIAYLAQNPAKPQEWAMATFKRDVYLSPDAGKTWSAIAQAGQTLK